MTDHIYIIVSVNDKDEEGICAQLGPEGWMPAFSSSWKIIETIKEKLKSSYVRETDAPARGRFRVIRFLIRDVIEEFEL